MDNTTKKTKKDTKTASTTKVEKDKIERETINGHDFVRIYKKGKLIVTLTEQEFEQQEAEK